MRAAVPRSGGRRGRGGPRLAAALTLVLGWAPPALAAQDPPAGHPAVRVPATPTPRPWAAGPSVPTTADGPTVAERLAPMRSGLVPPGRAVTPGARLASSLRGPLPGPDSTAPAAPSPLAVTAGATLGAALGMVVGGVVGYRLTRGGPPYAGYEGFPGMVLGAAVGSAVAAPLGAHLAAGGGTDLRRGVGLSLGVTAVCVGMAFVSGNGAVLAAVPVAQLLVATSVAVESAPGR